MEDGVESIEELVKNRADRETEEQIQQGSDGEEENKSSGGVVKNLISALVSRGREGEEDVEEGEGKIQEDDRASNNPVEEGGGGGGGGGGIINSLISNIFHQSEGGGDGEKKSNGDGERDKNGGENEQVKAAAEESGGGGSVLDNIVSHLPKPISDCTAPETEEASMLIHSIVRD